MKLVKKADVIGMLQEHDIDYEQFDTTFNLNDCVVSFVFDKKNVLMADPLIQKDQRKKYIYEFKDKDYPVSFNINMISDIKFYRRIKNERERVLGNDVNSTNELV